MVGLRDGGSRNFDELGLETPFADALSWDNPTGQTEEFAFAETPFASFEGVTGEALAWLDMEGEDESNANEQFGQFEQWSEAESTCVNCGSRSEQEDEVWHEEEGEYLNGDFERCAMEESEVDREETLLESESWEANAEQIDFQNRVLARHIARTKTRRGPALPDLRDDQLAVIPGSSKKSKITTAEAAGRMLAAANIALAQAQAAGDADAIKAKRFFANSGYRSSDHQRKLWLEYFPKYYKRTRAVREAYAEGAHSDRAVDYMLDPKGFSLGSRIAAPGYSNHQNGIAVDLKQELANGKAIANDSDAASRRIWRGTWFHKWLKDNAATYGFVQLPSEEWHWEFKPSQAADTSTSIIPTTPPGTTALTKAKQSMLQELARIARSRAGRKSLGKCYRWVKQALQKSGLVDVYLPGEAAKNAGVELVKHGFVNVLKIDSYAIKSPCDAPVGSVLVYDKTSAATDKNAKYGHIEIRTTDGFASDYFSTRARTGAAANGLVGPGRSGRQLTGVYLKLAEPTVGDQENEEFAYDVFANEFEDEGFSDEEPYFEAQVESLASTLAARKAGRDYLGGKLWLCRDQDIGPGVALFIPAAALSQQNVDVLLYVHGLLGPCGRPKIVPEGLITGGQFKLAESVNAAPRPTILVVPQFQEGGSKSWRANSLDKPAALNAFISHVLQKIGTRQGIAAPTLGRFMIAGHSRAYGVIYPLARAYADPAMATGALARLTKMALLDASYGTFPKQSCQALIKSKPGLTIDVIYRKGTKTDKFEGNAETGPLRLLPVSRENVSHCAIPAHVLPALLAASAKQTVTNEHYAFESDFRDFVDEDEYLDEAFEGEFEANFELEEALEGFAMPDHEVEWHDEGEEDLAVFELSQNEHFEQEEEEEEDYETETDREAVAFDPAVNSFVESIMSRESPVFEQDTPGRWTRCFREANIDKLEQVYKDNQTAAAANNLDRNSCIVMLNVGLGQLLNLVLKESRARSESERRVKMGSLPTKSIQDAMAVLQKKGYALSAKRIDFYDRRRRTAGTLKPEALKTSVQKHVLEMSKREGCWYAYGMSIMDGYHSVLLLVDRTEVAPKIYWLDQFSAGLTVDVTRTLDDLLTERTKTFWQGVMDQKNKGYNTKIQLWPLRRQLK